MTSAAAVGQVLAAAFVDDPMFSYVLPDARSRRRRLAVLFAGSARHAARHGGIASVGEGAGLAVWTGRAHMTIGFADAARSGMLTLPARIGFGAARRLQQHERAAQAVIDRVAPASCAYLMALGADPRRRGEGLGRAAVAEALSQMRRVGLARCVLRTENAENIGLYEHLGFRRLASEPIAARGLVVHVFDRSTEPSSPDSGTM